MNRPSNPAGPPRPLLAQEIAAAVALCALVWAAPPLGGQALLPDGAAHEILRWSVREDTTAGTASWAAADERSPVVVWLAHHAGESTTELRVKQGDRTSAVAPPGWCSGKPVAAALDPQRAVVVWSCRAQREAPAKMELRLVDGGTPAGSVQMVGDAESTDAESDPSVAACASRILVAWDVKQGDGGIAARFLDADGTPLATPLVVDRGPAGPPQVACGGQRFLVTWSDGKTVWTRAFDAAGREAGPRAAVAGRKNTGTQTLPAVAMDANGAAVFVWLEREPGGQLEVFLRRFDAQGLPSGTDLRLDSVTESNDFLSTGPRAALDSQGDILAVWQGREASTGPSRGLGRIVGAHRGLPLEAEFALDERRESFFPGVASDPAGGFLVSWTEAPEGSADRDLWLRRLPVGPLAAAPRTPAEVTCQADRAAAALAQVRPVTGALQQSLALSPAPGGGAAGLLTAGERSAEAQPAAPGASGPGVPSTHEPLVKPSPFMVLPQGGIAPRPAADRPAVQWLATDPPVASATPGPAAPPPPAAGCGPEPSAADVERSAWLAAHLLGRGDVPLFGLLVYRGEGIDTFFAELHALPVAAGLGAGHMAAQIRLLCDRRGQPALVRLRLLKARCSPEEGRRCSDPALPYGLSWRQDAASRQLHLPTLGMASAAGGADELTVDVRMAPAAGEADVGVAELCPATVVWR